MGEVVVVGLDIAKSVFQAHGVDAEGQVVIKRRLTRAKLIAFFEALPRCLIGIEACASAHHWGRRLITLGHEVKLMPPYQDALLLDRLDANEAHTGSGDRLAVFSIKNCRPAC